MQTIGVGSKYDEFWAGLLPLIRAQVELAVGGNLASMAVPGLTRLGARQSWYGTAEIRGQEMTCSSGAHATSLGRTVEASGLCRQWPQRAFRFTITPAGDLLTITIVGNDRRAPRPAPGPGGQPPVGRPPERPRPAWRAEPAGRDHPPGMADSRGSDVDTFYRILDELAARLGGPRRLRECTGRSGWPPQGLYFFYENDENRADGSRRIVRVGTHGLTETSKATLWGRLAQHRGQLAGRNPGGGAHRASVFRRHVGAAIINRDGLPDELLASWLDRHHPRSERAIQEADIERAVSRYIGAMPFLWLSVPCRTDRGYLESNSIALLSRLTGGPDRPGASWLGQHAERAEIRESGLWNVQHVFSHHEPAFLQRLAKLVELHQ